ncbi:MAG: hypothetical protein M3P33_03970 [bacterium]|nr:hypothetical protein [bacterium]
MKLKVNRNKNKKPISIKHSKLLSRIQKHHSKRFTQSRKKLMATPIKGKPDFRQISFQGIRFSKIQIILLGMFFVLFFMGYIAFFTSILKISEIKYASTKSLDCVDHGNIQTQLIPKNPFIWEYVTIDKNSFKNKHPCVNNVWITWSPLKFNTYTVYVTSQKPILRIVHSVVADNSVSESQDSLFDMPIISRQIKFASRNGNLFKMEKDSKVMEIELFGSKNYLKDKLPDNLLDFVFQFNNYIKKEYATDTKIVAVEGGTIRSTFLYSDYIYLTTRVSLGQQLNSLQSVLKQSTINKQKIGTIDLRFGNPIIRFKQ